MQSLAVRGLSDRIGFARAADWLAIAVVVSLPWSTSATGVLIALWLLALIPTLDLAALRRSITIPAAAIPVALFVLGALGMLWADASWAERLGALKSYWRLLVIPLLFVQFQKSDRGLWVLGGFLASCTVLLVASWCQAIWPSVMPRLPPPPGLVERPAGVPVKDYIIQSSEFLICAFALIHLAISAWREGRIGRVVVLVLLALAFLANIVFVFTARSTVVVFVPLLLVLAVQRFNWKGVVGVMLAGATLAAMAWVSSPYLRGRVLAVAEEIREYQTVKAGTSSGIRLEFWKKSLQFISEAPVLGHGTGSVMGLFRKAATGEGVSAAVTDQPHNQTLIIAIQLGLVGAALLFAMWIAHLLLFRGGALVAWLGLGLVVQNIVLCLFNSYVFEFTLGWLYIFGVGVLGGMLLGGSDKRATLAVPGADGGVAPPPEGR